MLLPEARQVPPRLPLPGRLQRLQDCHHRARVPISLRAQPEVAHMAACLLRLLREGPVQRLRGRDRIAERMSQHARFRTQLLLVTPFHTLSS
jgi:hypothetical protein